MENQRKILVIEDEPNMLELMRMLLDSKGYFVLTADNGETGVQLASQEIPDLIIADIMVPKLSGWDVIIIVRNDPRMKNIPILVCSVKNAALDLKTGYRLGVTDYLIKPFTAVEFLAKVATLVEPSFSPKSANK